MKVTVSMQTQLFRETEAAYREESSKCLVGNITQTFVILAKLQKENRNWINASAYLLLSDKGT